MEQSFVERELNCEKENYYDLALKMGFLIPFVPYVFSDESPNKSYLIFSNPIFEEYFAACAINDASWFLPRDARPEGKEFRAFQSKWENVILFWLKRSDIEITDKDSFINRLINLKSYNHQYDSGGGYLEKTTLINREYHEYPDYFMAAKKVFEFKYGKSHMESIYYKTPKSRLIEKVKRIFSFFSNK